MPKQAKYHWKAKAVSQTVIVCLTTMMVFAQSIVPIMAAADCGCQQGHNCCCLGEDGECCGCCSSKIPEEACLEGEAEPSCHQVGLQVENVCRCGESVPVSPAPVLPAETEPALDNLLSLLHVNADHETISTLYAFDSFSVPGNESCYETERFSQYVLCVWLT